MGILQITLSACHLGCINFDDMAPPVVHRRRESTSSFKERLETTDTMRITPSVYGSLGVCQYVVIFSERVYINRIIRQQDFGSYKTSNNERKPFHLKVGLSPHFIIPLTNRRRAVDLFERVNPDDVCSGFVYGLGTDRVHPIVR